MTAKTPRTYITQEDLARMCAWYLDGADVTNATVNDFLSHSERQGSAQRHAADRITDDNFSRFVQMVRRYVRKHGR